ncbi:hypothetical protein BC936DRAFT_141937, partial [Jimgerdemannia flammicorona]
FSFPSIQETSQISTSLHLLFVSNWLYLRRLPELCPVFWHLLHHVHGHAIHGCPVSVRAGAGCDGTQGEAEEAEEAEEHSHNRSGIGRQLALEYAAPGVIPILLPKDGDHLHDIANRCSTQGAEAIEGKLDLSRGDKLENLWLRQPIDHVIANAGSSALDLRAYMWHDMYKHIVDINITSVYGGKNDFVPLICVQNF